MNVVERQVEDDIIETDDHSEINISDELDDLDDLNKHEQKWTNYLEEKEALLEEKWTVTKGTVTWNVVRELNFRWLSIWIQENRRERSAVGKI